MVREVLRRAKPAKPPRPPPPWGVGDGETSKSELRWKWILGSMSNKPSHMSALETEVYDSDQKGLLVHLRTLMDPANKVRCSGRSDML